MTDPATSGQADMKGWLYKWTNLLKGYQKRWFVLSNGVLSYYRSQAEMAHTCRGTINLQGAYIHCEESTNFVVSNGGTKAFYMKASNPIERQRWITALQLAKANTMQALDNREEEDDDDNEMINYVSVDTMFEEATGIKTLVRTLESMKTCFQLVTVHGTSLQKALSELETVENMKEAMDKINVVNEKSTLFRITSSAMINKCNEYLSIAQTSSCRWKKMLEYERDQRQRLEEMLIQLAKQHDILEQAANKHRPLQKNDVVVRKIPTQVFNPKIIDSDVDDNFYDAQSEEEIELPQIKDSDGLVSENTLVIHDEEKDIVIEESTKRRERAHSLGTLLSVSSIICQRAPGTLVQNGEIKPRRVKIPEKPNYSANLWTIIKNCIGKDLSRIPMPVNFSEPLSMLQRLVEDFEYSSILDHAAAMDDPDEQLAYVAAFSISCYSSTAFRTGKPFNPFLGETYECDRREDFGWRIISEQVSHHPPIAAQYCEGKYWTCWQELEIDSKFRGRYLQVIPLGTIHLKFKKSGHHITWKKVTTYINNIIIGKLWVDQVGDTDIINHNTGSKCHLNYVEHSFFSRESKRKVKGCVLNKDGEARWVVNGNWDSLVEIAPVVSTDGKKDNPVYKTGEYVVAWELNPLPEDAEKYYNFSMFARQLNELEDKVAPTDSRLRPDQRLMEDGKWDDANEVKIKLEEKQREVRRNRQKEYMELLAQQAQESVTPRTSNVQNFPQADVVSSSQIEASLTESQQIAVKTDKHLQPPYDPIWFKREMDPDVKELSHIYKGGYWEAKRKQDWKKCPDVF